MFKTLLKKFFLKENSYTDRKMLLSTLDIWEKIIKNFTKDIGNTKYIDEDSYLLSQVIDTEFGELGIEFTLDKNEQGYGNYQPSISKNEGGIDFICINLGNIFKLDDKVAYVKNKEDIDKSILIDSNLFLKILHSFATQNVFIHEFTHFCDDNTKYSVIDAEQKNKKVKNYDYYNDAQEKNAFYMTWLLKIIQKTFEKYSKNMSKLSPEQRLDFITNEWKNDKEFLTYYNKLDNKSKKRLMNRLYSYFSTDFYKK